MPGVETVGAISSLPLSNSEDLRMFAVDGYPNQKGQLAEASWATPNYFRAMRIPLIAGRLFTADEKPGAHTPAEQTNTHGLEVSRGDSVEIGAHARITVAGGHLGGLGFYIVVLADEGKAGRYSRRFHMRRASEPGENSIEEQLSLLELGVLRVRKHRDTVEDTLGFITCVGGHKIEEGTQHESCPAEKGHGKCDLRDNERAAQPGAWPSCVGPRCVRENIAWGPLKNLECVESSDEQSAAKRQGHGEEHCFPIDAGVGQTWNVDRSKTKQDVHAGNGQWNAE